MSHTETVAVLNELLVTHYRSLPMYLSVAAPWTRRGDEHAATTIEDIVGDQQQMCRRLAELIQRRGGRPETGEYKIGYTDTHFLSLDFLIKELVAEQRNHIEMIERDVVRLAHDAEARELAEETLGAARGHLESLEELLRTTANAG